MAKKIVFLLITSLLFFCQKGIVNEEEEVKKVVETSLYTGKEFDKALDESDTSPGFFSSAGGIIDSLTIPWVKFRRKVDSVERYIRVRIPAYPGYPDTTALATITARISGRFFVVNIKDSLPPPIYVRPIFDSSYSQVYLTKGKKGWKVRKITPKAITTVDASSLLKIEKFRTEAKPSGRVFEITTSDTLLTKDQLPTFRPEDTVRVLVTISFDTDSGWIFLHRGPKGDRKREPFYKTSSNTFERTWIISNEPIQTAVVRPAAIDFIGWRTLFGDSSALYNSSAWALPYVIKKDEEAYPED